MTDSVDKDLVRQLSPPKNLAGDLSVRSGVVTAISGHTATITLGGKSIPGVPVYFSVTVTVGSVVDVLFVGKSPRVIGVTG